MNKSTLYSVANPLLRLPLRRSWSVGSLVAILGSVIVSTTAFSLNQAGTSQIILLGTIATFLLVTIVHVRFISFAQDHSRQTTELLWNKEREFQSIFENALDAILVLDDNGNCLEANPSAENFFSTRNERLNGRSLRAFFAEVGDFDAMWSKLQADQRYRGD